MKIGYARVSTDDQNIDLQRRALAKAGCRTVFEDQASGRDRQRPGLQKALARLAAGDVLIVWRLDRLGRSVSDLIHIVNEIAGKDAHFRSITEDLNTASAGGRLYFHMAAAIAQFERDLGLERTHAGLAAARARGVRIGRKPALSARQVEHARLLLETVNANDVARTLNVSRATLYRHLKKSEAETV